MHLIHGTWIPDDTDNFVQPGAFYVWIETDLPSDVARRRKGEAIHPRHLAGAALEGFLAEKLGVLDTAPNKTAKGFQQIHLLLPSAGGEPLPSFELRPYVDSEFPDEFGLAPWQVEAYRLPNAIARLNDLFLVSLNAPDEFQLGADVLFWHQLARLVKSALAKDQYIPALRYHELPAERGSGKGKKAKSGSSFELRAGWEIVSPQFDAALPRYVAAMPLACCAGSLAPSDGRRYDRESLVRHFAEHVLREAITATPFTAKHDGQYLGTFLADAIYPNRPGAPPLTPEAALEEYAQWFGWREKLTRAQTTAGFTLGFRLEEPDSTADPWSVRFVAASRSDPSFRLDLEDYWTLTSAGRADLAPYFGRDVEKNLLLALGHAARIYPKVWEGLETAEPVGFSLSLEDAFAFLKEHAWVLEDAGYRVMVPAWYTPAGRRRAKVRLRTAARTGTKGPAVTTGYFSVERLVAYEYQLLIGEQAVSVAEWEQLIAAKTPLVQFRGQWIELDRAKMAELLEFWKKNQAAQSELTIPDLLRLQAESAGDLEWEHDSLLREMLSRLEDKSAFAPIDDLPELQATLRDYQKRGVAWLAYLESLGLNPCLADDMGLGKTLEVIAHLVRERRGRASPPSPSPPLIPPTLVIAPTSVLSNWRREIERFAPQLRAAVHHGAGRPRGEKTFCDAYAGCDVVITSFALARLDEKLLRSMPWQRVVVDEAQNIKNPEAAQTKAVGKLNARYRLALTGTPVENRLMDLWSIFNFLNPGYLGKQAQFRKGFELPIQRDDDPARSATLKKLVEPFILRRLKTDRRIIADLPDKIEQKLFCNLTPEQASLYAAIVKDVEENLDQVDGISRRGLILATLTKLKQVCNHPAQFLQDGSAFGAERSHKLQRLTEMTEEAIESGDSLLIFTQFAEMGNGLEAHLARALHCPTYFLHGATSVARREKMVAEFQDPESPPAVFILSLRAGGVGLNLTRANHVFHFDRWWNPAVEDQATDRAFRIGQRKNVFVHKFVAVGTLEERIDQLIEDKKRVAGSIIGADESWLTDLDNATFKDLIALRRGAVLD
jgi:SNF2 family DNA or RNA helicase